MLEEPINFPESDTISAYEQIRNNNLKELAEAKKASGLFECDWTMEWAGYSIAYLVFVCSVSLYNYGHPKFLRTAPDALQVRFECSINLILRKYILLNRSRLLTEFFGCSHDIRFWWMIRCSGQ